MSTRQFRHFAAGDDDAEGATPWDRPASQAAAKDPSNRPPEAVLERLRRARSPRSEPSSPPVAPPDRSPRPSADASLSDGDSLNDEAFWARPEPVSPAPAEQGDYLSGPEEVFDAATGWDFSAITDSQIPSIGPAAIDYARPSAAPPGDLVRGGRA